jgi:hypothetical protein
MSDIRDKARGYLSRYLQALYPNIEPLADLLGVCTQIDNVLAGQQAEIEKLRVALIEINELNSKRLGYSKKIERVIWKALGEKE